MADLEVWFPLVLWRLARRGSAFHSAVEGSTQYRAFIRNSGTLWKRFHIACSNTTINQLTSNTGARSTGKSPRPVSAKKVSFDYAMTTLLDSRLFCAAHDVACGGRERSFLACYGCTSSQVKSSILSFCEVDDTFDMSSVLVTSLTTDAPQSTVLIAMPRQQMNEIRLFLLSDWRSDTSRLKHIPCFITPHLCTAFEKKGTRYATLRALLRWTCVVRSQTKGLFCPSEAGFALYEYLPIFLSRFNISNEMLRLRGAIANRQWKKGTFFRGLVSFLQQKRPHVATGRLLKMLYNLMADNQRGLQATFPHVWNMAQQPAWNNVKFNDVNVPLNDVYRVDGTDYPAHCWIYAMAAHPQVAPHVAQAIWTDLDILDTMCLPRSFCIDSFEALSHGGEGGLYELLAHVERLSCGVNEQSLLDVEKMWFVRNKSYTIPREHRPKRAFLNEVALI